MAAATDLDILDRIRNIMRAYTGYSAANDLSEGDAQTVLPSFIVAPLDTAWDELGARRFLVTQGFEIIGIVAAITNIDPLANRLAAYRVAMPIVRPWVEWLHAHPLLSLNNDGGLVQSVGSITAGGYGTYTYQQADYSSFRLQILVTTYNS